MERSSCSGGNCDAGKEGKLLPDQIFSRNGLNLEIKELYPRIYANVQVPVVSEKKKILLK